jgi:hypothetical protein
MAASVADGGRYNAPGGHGSGGIFLGGWATQAQDCALTFFKWEDVDATPDFFDDGGLTWTARTKRHHTASGSNLRMQLATSVNLPALTAVNFFAGPPTSVDNREGVSYIVRGVTAAPIASSDNVAYATGTSITGPAADPGSGGGVVIAFFTWNTAGVTPTVPGGWTAGADIHGTASRTAMIYKVASGAGSLTPSMTFSSSVDAMCTSIALSAPVTGTPTSVTGYLEETAVGRTVTVLLWPTNDPSTGLADKHLAVPLIAATDPGGAAAAKFTVTPAPAGTTNGQVILAAAFDPANQDTSSYGFPATVSA